METQLKRKAGQVRKHFKLVSVVTSPNKVTHYKLQQVVFFFFLIENIKNNLIFKSCYDIIKFSYNSETTNRYVI